MGALLLKKGVYEVYKDVILELSLEEDLDQKEALFMKLDQV